MSLSDFHQSKLWICILGAIVLKALLLQIPALDTPSISKSSLADTHHRAERHVDQLSSDDLAGLELRSIGPAVFSGRITSIAVDGLNHSHYFVGSASGGVWETRNDGGSWTPIFDREGSSSIGSIAIDPKAASIIWVGTGDPTAMKFSSYGDGVYRSNDGGKNWKNVGLKSSEHIASIVIDPRHSDTVFVAAQGPLWSSGGDRGLYKTTDGGESWERILWINDQTGVTDIAMDPTNPECLYVATWERERNEPTMLDGGPGSGIYKTEDGGISWVKLTRGLPSADMGRIALSISPVDSTVVYAEIEAAKGQAGIFRSGDKGAHWEKRNAFAAQGTFYGRMISDPKNLTRLYVINTYVMSSDDGGATLRVLPHEWRHADDHVLWVDPINTDHILVGCDNGLYKTYDRGNTWVWNANLPISQFYDVAVDNSSHFYYVYGGTQDNFSLAGPSRTFSASGVVNSDWFVTTTGDGFRSQIDPLDPNIVYAESQYGSLVRFDRRTLERKGIKPQELNTTPLRWNWDTPFIISPHYHDRIYIAGNVVFRSDDRGDSWHAVSPDLANAGRSSLPVETMRWADAIGHPVSTARFGTITEIVESPLKAGLIYIATDAGLIKATRDGGVNWTTLPHPETVPVGSFIVRLLASRHDVNLIYAAFDNHRRVGDFSPYLLKSADGGHTWQSIADHLPQNAPVLAFAEDPVDPALLFAGTELGLYVSTNGGRAWAQIKGNLPTVAVRDLKIQERDNDLVVATFGRGIYILDDITALRHLRQDKIATQNILFPVRRCPLFIETMPLGVRGKGFQGISYYTASNAPYGAIFTYSLAPEMVRAEVAVADESKRAARPNLVVTPELISGRQKPRIDPSNDFFLSVFDSSGKLIREISLPNRAGLRRVNWDLRYAPLTVKEDDDPLDDTSINFAPLVTPGFYSATISRRSNGTITQLAGPERFEVYAFSGNKTDKRSRRDLAQFQEYVASLFIKLEHMNQLVNSVRDRLSTMRQELNEAPRADSQWPAAIEKLDSNLALLMRTLDGETLSRDQNHSISESVTERLTTIFENERMSALRPTRTDRESCRHAAKDLAETADKLKTFVEIDLKTLENAIPSKNGRWPPLPESALPSR